MWQEARKADDFAAFRPSLEKIVALKRRRRRPSATRACPTTPCWTSTSRARPRRKSRAFSRPCGGTWPRWWQAIASSGRTPPRDILEREYPVERQQAFGQAAAAAIGFDFEAGRLDTTTHPFCSGIGPGDCRITTRYNPRHFNESFFGILHEAGHGIYEQGLPAAHHGTPLGTAASLGIHESQSRLWENQVGRGRPFWEHFFPRRGRRSRRRCAT